jgi:hypothetical protein
MSRRKDLIDEKEDAPLSFKNIANILGEDKKACGFYMYDSLNSVTPANFYAKPCAIILMQNKKSGDPTGHFFAILKHRNFIEHFDSYGFTIDDELRITGEPPYIKQMLNEQAKPVMETKYKFQSLKNDSETCGRWCAVRVKMRDMLPSEFHDFFETPVVSKDQKVTLATYFLG